MASREREQLEHHIEFNGISDNDRDVIALLKKALSIGGGYATAAREIAAARGLDIEPKPKPDYSQPIPYNADEHILLCDEAHKGHLYKEEEYERFLDDVRAEIDPVFQVACPNWPPVERSPLVLLMSTGGGSVGGPFDDKPWRGVQWAVEYSRRNRIAVQRIRKGILHPERFNDMDRTAYRWQVPIFNPARYVRLRRWVDLNGLDLPNVLRTMRERGLQGCYVETVNPYMLEEMRSGSFTGTCRSILREELARLEREFLNGRKSRIPGVPAWPRWDYRVHRNDDGAVPEMEGIGESEVYQGGDEDVAEKPQNWEFLEKGARVYSHFEVAQALQRKLPNVRFFGGRTADDEIMGITPEALGQFLLRDKTNKMTYVRNVGGRSFDCDDFAVLLRAGMSRQGVHAVGIIAGDKHAWNVVVLATGDEPNFAFVEPQTDGEVASLEGQYSVAKRCEVFL